MQHTMLFALIGVIVISAGTLGFANVLTVTAGATNPIGGADELIAAPNGQITDVSWTEIATSDGDIEIDSADVDVENTDGSNPHTYELCVVLSDGASVASVLGCQTTGSILASATSTINVDFGTDFDTIVATQIYFTLEETV